MPPVLIGGVPFIDRYPQWPDIIAYFRQAIDEEIASQRTPRAYLGDKGRFLQFFLTHITARPELGINENQVNDIIGFVHDEFFGLGMLRAYLEDPEIEDLLMDSWRRMDVVKGGRKHSVPTPFADDQDAREWMKRMLGDEPFNENHPVANGQLADGSRIICLRQPVVETCGFAIRKHRAERFSPEHYVASQVAPVEFFADVAQWIARRFNILMSGATGSGKTTMLNYVATLIDEEERLIILEDTPELLIPHPRAYRLTTKGSGARIGQHDENDITIRHLVGHTLRMKPDRIVVGEVRGPEAFDMLNSMNTGHDGGLTTLHANSPAEAVLRLESLAVQAMDNMPLWALQDLIANTIGIIIQLKQLPRSSRRVVVEASQVLHPTQALSEADLQPPSRKLRENLYLRPLWRWNNRTGGLERVAPPAELADQYFA